MRFFYILFVVFSFQAVSAQELTLRKGVVVDSLAINDSIAETFSLYLPTYYSNDRSWPVVFVFDSEGRGRTATQVFREAAETQGYIVAASNNIDSKASLLDNVTVGTRLMNKIFGFFPVDQNGIYTAGYAEGAQVASALPTVFDQITGVLAMGDTWLNTDFIAKGAKFSFIGLVGYSDYRSTMFEETAQFLNLAKFPATVYKFTGAREWPESEMIFNAMGDFTLRQMAKGNRPKDEALIDRLYEADMATVDRLRRMMQPYKAYEYLEQLDKKYEFFGKKQDIRNRLKELRRDKAFKSQRRAYNNAAIKEIELQDRYLYFFNEDVGSANFENLGWWSQQMKELKELQEGNNIAESEMAARFQGLLQALANNTFKDLKAKNAAIDPLIFTAILQTIFDSENPDGYMNIISLSAQDGDYYTALLYLEDLLKTGYKDIEALYNIPGTLDLKLSPEYNTLIKKYLGESKYYDI